MMLPSILRRFRSTGVGLLLTLSAAFTPACSSQKPPAEEPAVEPGSAPAAERSSAPAEGELAPGEPLSGMPVEADDARLGSATARVTVVAFLDYECSFCARGFATLEALRDRYTEDELRIVFKHLPLDFHPLALPSAVAGQAVQDLAGSEAFFQFSRRAFSAQAEISYVNLALWAEEVGVPRELYNDAVGRQDTMRRVATDVVLARRSGVDGTPAFFINGRLLGGARPMSEFHARIDEELEAVPDSAVATAEQWRVAYQARVKSNMSESLVAALLEKDPHDYKVPVDGSATWGRSDAPVTIVAFSDYECPYCKRAEATLTTIRERHADDVRIVFKHLPLAFHKNARPAALLAEAVFQELGLEAFMNVHARLYELSPELGEDALLALAAEMGLSASTARDAIRGRIAKVGARIRKDDELAENVKAAGTPHFFVNGKRLAGARNIEQFEALIRAGKARAEVLIAEGTPPDEVYAALQKDAIEPGAPHAIEAQLDSKNRPVRGDADAPVTVHVFSDFECPYCRRVEVTLRQLDQLFPGKLKYVWHDHPLPFHEHARPAAQLGRAVYEKKGSDAFWTLHDGLFDLEGDGEELTRERLVALGKSAGLSEAQVALALEGTAQDAVIDEDMELAKSVGITGTPAFVIGGYLVTGARPLSHFERIVRLVLSSQSEP